MKKDIHFIINPISGSGKQQLTQEHIISQLGVEEYNIHTKISKYKHHAIELAKTAIREKANIIIACGGDGTINEVASCLAGTDIPLGIVPMGSGNGLASHLKISKKIEKALRTIKNGVVTKIDVGQVNSTYFFSNIGLGFDSDVIHNYEKGLKRSFPSYIRAVYKSYRNYSSYAPIYIAMNGEKWMVNPFMVFISNSNEMGYKMSLTPKASLSDGLLDVVLIPKLKKYRIPLLLFLFLIKRIHLLKEVKYITTKNIGISKNSGTPFELQRDGEFFTENTPTINVSVNNKFLNVIVP